MRVEVKRQSIRLYPPLPAAEQTNIIPMHGSPEGQNEAAFARQPQRWGDSWQDAVAS
ncbi:MAG: hypothetical protein JWO82_3096 [Akkermansiaceae bacterium]|nr:hypothetical protein [Akkermansiaceae bacterium]